MNPHKLSVAFPTVESPASLEPAIGLFHRMIQYRLLEGLVLDVADYRHVPHGPGVALMGVDVDYAVTESALTVTRKRAVEDDAATQLRDVLRMALGAIEAIAADGQLDATFDRSTFSVKVFDRQLGDRNTIEAELAVELEPVVIDIFGEDARVAVVANDDPRRAPQVQVSTNEAAGEAALDVLGGARPHRQSPWDITVEDLVRLRASDEEFVLLDVREESEYDIVNLGGQLMPLATVGDRLDELDKDAHIVIHCRAGYRGATAVTQLRDAGFHNAWNVNGALMAWIDRIDPSLPRY